MIKIDKNVNDVNFILDNLRKEDLEELIALWGNNWKEKVLKNTLNFDFFTLFGKNKEGKLVPIAFGGFAQVLNDNPKIVCAWLLCSEYIEFNKKYLLKNIKEQLIIAKTKYQIMYNFIYKSNFESKRWLKRFGFNFDNPKPKGMQVPNNFEFFYINNEKGIS